MARVHWLSVMAPVCVWLALVEAERKWIAVVGAMVYGAAELCWYAYWYDRWFTTWQQFFVNVLWLPVTLCLYNAWLAESVWVRLLLYPVNLWAHEVITGYYLHWALGENRAWLYEGPWTYFRGQISLVCAPRWWVVGCLQEIGYPIVVWLVQWVV